MRGAKGQGPLFALLYVSEGAPIGFLWFYLEGVLIEAGLPLQRVTSLLAAVALLWTAKFIWAPCLDVLRTPRWGYRAWLLAAQLVMAVSLVPLAWLDLAGEFRFVVALCMLHGLAAATQDAAIDALAITTLRPERLPRINAWMWGGMMLGRALFGGAAIEAGSEFGRPVVVIALVGVILTIGIVARLAPLAEAAVARSAGGDFGPRFLRALRSAVARPAMRWGLLFAAVAGAGFEAVGGVASAYLVECGAPAWARGRLFTFLLPAAMVLGGALAGWLSERFGQAPAVRGLLVLLALCILPVALLPPGSSAARMFATFSLFYVATGAFIVASYALLMRLVDAPAAGTQFSALMGMTNLCETWAIAAVGQLAAAHGYCAAFLAMAAVSLLALPLVGRFRAPAG